MSYEETYWENRFKGLNDQYTQTKAAYLDVVQAYSAQFHQIDELQKENSHLKLKLENTQSDLSSTKKTYLTKLSELTKAETENSLLQSKLEKLHLKNRKLKQLARESEGKTNSLTSENLILKQKIDDLIQKLEKLENQEIRRSSNSESINEFAKSVCLKVPKMIESLPLFMGSNGLRERHLSDLTGGNFSETTTSTSSRVNQEVLSRITVGENPNLNLFEAFYMIGISNDSLGKSSSSPEILYEYSKYSVEIFNKSILAEFCFPSEIKSRQLRESTSEEEMNNILYSQDNDIRNCNCYVFTLKSNYSEDQLSSNSELPNSDRQYIYCVCIQFEDIAVETQANIEWINTKCLCLTSFLPCFELHFQVLRTLLQVKRLWRMNTIAKFDNIRESLRINTEEISYKWEEVLNKYSSYSNPLPNFRIFIEDYMASCIDYTFPNDLSLIDIAWLFSPLKSKIDVNDFLWLFAAMLQEKSIVFVSYNLDLLTSCVLAMQTLLRPLKWPYFFMPLIPDNLRELLDAPFPILAGIPGSAPDNRKYMSHIIWVLLDECTASKRISSSRSRVQDVHELPNSYLLNKFKSLYISEDQELKTALVLREMIKEYIEKFRQNDFNSTEEIHKMVTDIIPSSEQEFYQSLVQTQMFYTFIENSIAW